MNFMKISDIIFKLALLLVIILHQAHLKDALRRRPISTEPFSLPFLYLDGIFIVSFKLSLIKLKKYYGFLFYCKKRDRV